MESSIEAVPRGAELPARAAAKPALYILLLIMAADSFVLGYTNDQPHVAVMLVLAVLFSFVTFFWYCRDSDAMGFRRSLLLNIAIIGVGPLSVPYYLARSRPKGTKARAVLRFLGFLGLLVGASVLGTVAGALAA